VALYNLHCGRAGTVLFRKNHRGTLRGAVSKARRILSRSEREAMACQVDLPEVSRVTIYRHNVGPNESAGWSHSLVAEVPRRRPTLYYQGLRRVLNPPREPRR